MTDDEGRPDPLNEHAKPFRRWAGQAFAVVGLIVVGIVAGARLGQPVRKVEQSVTAPIRNAVARSSPAAELPELVRAACPAVVALRPRGWRGLPAQGIILTGDGFVVTTAPMPARGSVAVLVNDGRRLRATVQASDALSGISLLKIEGAELPSIALAETDLPRLGAWGFTLASPAGRGCIADAGTIASDFAAEGATHDYYVRAHSTATILPPGTPFVSADGRVAAMARNADRFVPGDLITTVTGYLMRGIDPSPNRFGVIVEDISPILADRLDAGRDRGAVLVLVGKGSIAEAAGLRVGDIVLSAGRSPISSASELNRALGGGKPIELVIVRGGDQTTVTATLRPKG